MTLSDLAQSLADKDVFTLRVERRKELKDTPWELVVLYANGVQVFASGATLEEALVKVLGEEV